jgi:hypothetical protein
MKQSIRIGSAIVAALFAGAALADITVYNRDNFAGPAMTLSGEYSNLRGTGFYDSISSIDVHSGRWEFCSLPEHRGDCRVLEAGRYASLPQALNHRIESVRPLDRVAYEPRAYEEGRYAYRRGPVSGAVELYAAPGFRGPSISLDRDAWNLERRGFGERASSVIVHEGRWELCTDRGFDGRCRVFGPGEYPRLGRGLDDQVSSLRRIG